MSRHTAIHNTLGKAVGNNLRRLAHLATHGTANAPYQGQGHTHRAIDTAVAIELSGLDSAIRELTPLIAAEAAAHIDTPDSRQRVVWLLALQGTHTALITWLRANCAGCHADFPAPMPLDAPGAPIGQGGVL